MQGRARMRFASRKASKEIEVGSRRPEGSLPTNATLREPLRIHCANPCDPAFSRGEVTLPLLPALKSTCSCHFRVKVVNSGNVPHRIDFDRSPGGRLSPFAQRKRDRKSVV